MWEYNGITVPDGTPLVAALQTVVTVQDVQNLLLQRKIVGHLDREPKVAELIEPHAREVAANIGDSTRPEVFGLAAWATILGTASATESALFPEQQAGADGQAEYWYRRYQGALVRVREASGLTSGGQAGASSEPFSGTLSIRGRRT